MLHDIPWYSQSQLDSQFPANLRRHPVEQSEYMYVPLYIFVTVACSKVTMLEFQIRKPSIKICHARPKFSGEPVE